MRKLLQSALLSIPVVLLMGCPPKEEKDCADGVDDDKDGLIDCADSDCDGTPECTEDCANGEDDDADGDIDCNDDDCTSDVACDESQNCDDGADNDGDGDTDCDDDDCLGNSVCPEICDNGVDDNGDGDIDCADATCAGTPPCATFTGSLTYLVDYTETYDTDGTPLGARTVCDAEIALNGTAYTGGACAGCDYAFEVDATFTRDDSAPDCQYIAWLSYTPNADGLPTGLSLGFSEGSQTFYSGYDYAGAPYFFPVITPEDPDHSASLSNGTLTWSYNAAYGRTASLYEQDCADAPRVASPATSLTPGATSGTGSLPCDGSVIDVWELSLVAGDTAAISVDTVADATAFDPWMWVNDANSCTIMDADDSADCTFPPPQYQCPSAEFTAATSGVHQVVVASFGSCASGDTGDYSIEVTSPGNPTPSLAGDDVQNVEYTTADVVYAIDGSGTIQ